MCVCVCVLVLVPVINDYTGALAYILLLLVNCELQLTIYTAIEADCVFCHKNDET